CSDSQIGLDDSGGETFGQLSPRRASVTRFEDAAAGSIPRAVFPWALASFPKRGISDLRVRGIDQHVSAAGVLVFVQHLLESLPIVGCLPYPTIHLSHVKDV